MYNCIYVRVRVRLWKPPAELEKYILYKSGMIRLDKAYFSILVVFLRMTKIFTGPLKFSSAIFNCGSSVVFKLVYLRHSSRVEYNFAASNAKF